MIFHVQAYSRSKHYGRELNRHIGLLPDDCWVCVRDMDTLPLQSNWVDLLYEAIEDHPDTVLFTCATNRVFNKPLNTESDILKHIEKAKNRKKQYSYITNVVPAFMWLFRHSTWRENKFDDHPIIHGRRSFDARWTQQLKGTKRIIEHLYIWHTYRLGQNSRDYKHLI